MTMSLAAGHFELAIRDAEALLDHVKSLGNPLPMAADVFKRAGLIMAMTAWETYVEDRVREALSSGSVGSPTRAEKFMRSRLEVELKRLNNPTAEKTRQLFLDYVGVDVTLHWSMEGYERTKTAEKLDALLKTRGDVVHRLEKVANGPSPPHRVGKDDLEKAIRFLKLLVTATDGALQEDRVGEHS